MINANTTANSAMAMISSLVYAAIRNPRPRYGISLLLSIMLISRAKPSAGRSYWRRSIRWLSPVEWPPGTSLPPKNQAEWQKKPVEIRLKNRVASDRRGASGRPFGYYPVPHSDPPDDQSGRSPRAPATPSVCASIETGMAMVSAASGPRPDMIENAVANTEPVTISGGCAAPMATLPRKISSSVAPIRIPHANYRRPDR